MTVSRSGLRLAGGLIGLAYLASLATPAVLDGRTLQDASWAPGWSILLTGPLGLLVLQFAWLANPLIVVSVLLLLFGRRVSLWLAIPAAIFASEAFSWTSTPNDSPVPTHVLGHGGGFYLWVACAYAVLGVALGGRLAGSAQQK